MLLILTGSFAESLSEREQSNHACGAIEGVTNASTKTRKHKDTHTQTFPPTNFAHEVLVGPGLIIVENTVRQSRPGNWGYREGAQLHLP